MNKYILVFFLILECFFINQSFAGEPYIGVMVGVNGNLDLKGKKADASVGYYVGGNIGYRFWSLLRLEEELSYQRSDIHSFEKSGIKLHHARGHVNVWSLMTNMLFELNCPFIITPYFGGGIGVAHVNGHWSGHWNKVMRHLSSEGCHHHAKQKLRENGFAWQLIAGLKYFICLGLETSLEYRYFKVENEIINHRVDLSLIKFF